MVSYYTPSAMYRHQQQISASNGHFQASAPISWYGYHQGPAQLGAAPPPSPYCVQDDQQLWHHHPVHTAHGVFQHDFQEFVHNGMPMQHPQHPQHQIDPENQIPSPPITVSGSEMSSPGAPSDNISPPQNHNQNSRPPPARSPYEWIKKTSYQSQPTPGKTRTKDKYRVVYTDHQRIELEKEFTFNNKYITIRRKSELASTLGLSERQIKIWFQNRRAKERKQNKKRTEEKNQIDMVSNSSYQQNIMNPHQQIQHLDLQSQQNILPNIVPSSTVAMQRYIGNTMKLENNENEQLG